MLQFSLLCISVTTPTFPLWFCDISIPISSTPYFYCTSLYCVSSFLSIDRSDSCYRHALTELANCGTTVINGQQASTNNTYNSGQQQEQHHLYLSASIHPKPARIMSISALAVKFYISLLKLGINFTVGVIFSYFLFTSLSESV